MATKKNKYTDIDLSKYDSGYQKSQSVINAENNKINAENAVKNYGDFNYSNQAAYDKTMNDLLNRKEFSYDLNGDVLYQQYKDNYITQGKQASMDVMGQASAMTGGYGNSYAATVGNQTYQGYLQQLNNKIPELYQLALDRYNSEGDRLATNLGVLAQDRQTEYGEWGDKYNRLVADRDYHTNEYNSAYNRDYTTWTDNRDYDTSQYWNEYNTGYQAEQDELTRKYQAERDAIADAQWQKEFDEAQRQFNADQALKREQQNASLALQREELAWKKAQAAAEAAAKAEKEKTKLEGNDKTNLFKSSVMTQNEFRRRRPSGYSSYTDYVDGTLEKWYNRGDLTAKDVAYLKGYYGL